MRETDMKETEMERQRDINKSDRPSSMTTPTSLRLKC